MNIFKSSVRRGWHRKQRTARFAFPTSAAPPDAVEIGVRPEDVKVRPWSDNAVGRPAQVFEVEPLGGYTVVTLDAGATRLRALVRGQLGDQARGVGRHLVRGLPGALFQCGRRRHRAMRVGAIKNRGGGPWRTQKDLSRM